MVDIFSFTNLISCSLANDQQTNDSVAKDKQSTTKHASSSRGHDFTPGQSKINP